jgi:deoxyribose-phosphate aldolase
MKLLAKKVIAKKPKLTAEEKKKVAAASAGAKKDNAKVKTSAGNRKTTGVRKAGTA